MPHPCSRHPFEHAFTQRAVVFASFRLPARPRSSTRHRPGLSVKGWTHASGWRYDSRTDPPVSAKARLCADAVRAPLRRAGITNPTAVEMHKWAGSNFSFLRLTELTCAVHGLANIWVGAATWVVDRCIDALDHRHAGRRNPSGGRLSWDFTLLIDARRFTDGRSDYGIQRYDK